MSGQQLHRFSALRIAKEVAPGRQWSESAKRSHSCPQHG